MKWKTTLTAWAGFLTVALLAAGPVLAGLTPESGYGSFEATMEGLAGKSYAGGMDVVYAQVASGSAAGLTRCFLKVEDGQWSGQWGIQVNMYDYLGKYVRTLGSVLEPYGSGQYSVFAQAVKVNPYADAYGNREVWFSMTGTGASQGDWYKITVNSTYSQVISSPTRQFSQAGNWEVEWDPVSRKAFYAGKETNAWTDPHAIYLWTGSALQKVVEIGGYSCGFAFDPNGNLYTGTYTSSGPNNQQYVYMYTASQVASAVASKSVLTPANASNTISIPSINNVYLGANDLESDAQGNIYLTANGSWDPQYGSDVGYEFMIDKWNPMSPPSAMTLIGQSAKDPNNPNWLKSLAFDGSSSLSENGNRLYVDLDFWWGSGGPDKVAGLSVGTDTDGDGVPDALDNAYLTPNPGQQDGDRDMYGNIIDADFNNDGVVGTSDFLALKAKWLGSDAVVDMDGDGIVGTSDYLLFRSHWGETMGLSAAAMTTPMHTPVPGSVYLAGTGLVGLWAWRRSRTKGAGTRS